MELNENKPAGKSRKKMFLLLGLGLGTIVLGGLGYWYFTRPKDEQSSEDLPDMPDEDKSAYNNPKPKGLPAPSKTNIPGAALTKKFPLKDKSKGELVKQVQEALMKAYGDSILPKYGADGIFGKELKEALVSKGFPTVIDETTFNKILALNNPTEQKNDTPKDKLPDEDKTNIDIATKIWYNSTTKKLEPLLEQLKRIANVAHYIKINELYKKIRVGASVRKTIVNSTLSSFSDETSKQFIRNELKRIGLKYDSSSEKWSLSGVDEKKIITTQETTICNIEGLSCLVPDRTILGVEVTRGRHNTRFRTLDNQILYVPTKHIRYV